MSAEIKKKVSLDQSCIYSAQLKFKQTTTQWCHVSLRYGPIMMTKKTTADFKIQLTIHQTLRNVVEF